MNTQAAVSFAEWLAHDQPALFVELLKRAAPHATKGLSGFTDILSSIGTGLASAAQSVGTYISSPAGSQTLSTLAQAYVQSQAAKQAVSLNYQRAQQGISAAPIQTQYNPQTGQYEALLVQPGGQAIPITPQVRQSLLAGMPTWLPWAIGGGALLLVVLFFSRR